MVVIFPFEEKIYRDAGVPVDFVGHPLADLVHASIAKEQFAASNNLDWERPIVALLPGSRRKEIAQHYRTILDACTLIARQHSQRGAVQFVHAAAPGIDLRSFAGYERSLGIDIRHVQGAVYDVLAAADCAIVASGTATVEAALLGTPLVVIYRVAPELIQDDFTPEKVAAEVGRLLESADARAEMKSALAEVRAKLGTGGAMERAAEIFCGMLPGSSR